MQIKINYQDNNFKISSDLEIDYTFYSFLTNICDIFFKFKNYFDLNSFELFISNDDKKIYQKKPNANNYYFLYYDHNEELCFSEPILILKKINYQFCKLFGLYGLEDTRISLISKDYNQKSFFLKVKINKNTKLITKTNNVLVEKLDISEDTFEHLINLSTSFNLLDLSIDIIYFYLKKYNRDYDSSMFFIKDDPLFYLLKNKFILKYF